MFDDDTNLNFSEPVPTTLLKIACMRLTGDTRKIFVSRPSTSLTRRVS